MLQVYADPVESPSAAPPKDVAIKVPSAAVVAAAAIARAAGVTLLEGAVMVGSGGGQKPPTSASTGASSPRRHHNAACAGAKLNAVDDKENIDPITGLHARLASGASASPRGARAPAAGSRGVREGAGDEHARKPLADITAAFVRRGQLQHGKRVVIGSGAQGVIESVCAVEGRQPTAALTAGGKPLEGGVKVGIKRTDADGGRPVKRARVLRFTIR